MVVLRALHTLAELAAGYTVRAEHCPTGVQSDRVDLTIEGTDFLVGIAGGETTGHLRLVWFTAVAVGNPVAIWQRRSFDNFELFFHTVIVAINHQVVATPSGRRCN